MVQEEPGEAKRRKGGHESENKRREGLEGWKPTLRRNMENLCLVKLKMFVRYPWGRERPAAGRVCSFHVEWISSGK